MSELSKERSQEFLKISDQFKLGALTTESSHSVTANLSEVAKTDLAAALKLLFQADADVIKTFREFVQSGRAETIAATMLAAVKNGGKVFFTGCGSTGRLSILLDSVWRDFWQQQKNKDLENRTFSIMAGGDYALIKSVEGFEDFTAFGKKQIADLGVSAKDVVFAITEGGETSFVIGTAWQGVEAGAKVYFVYNNPDAVLCEHVQRSREVIQDARFEKVNLTTGPMAITGSTRMQATSIQLCVMLTVLEIVVAELTGKDAKNIPAKFLAQLETMYAGLLEPQFLASLAKLVEMEANVYRAGKHNNYFANQFGIDVLTDTTERSPTYCTPPFRKFDDATATESWAFLLLPDDWTDNAWINILKREPRCLAWNREEIFALAGPEKVERTAEIMTKIKLAELMRFKIGINGLRYRPQSIGDGAVAVISQKEKTDFHLTQLRQANASNARTAQLFFGEPASASHAAQLAAEIPGCLSIFVPVPASGFLLDGVTRTAVKLVMNALSTCTMVKLGRVLGNYMIWVVPSNLKLIDRATRYITKLTGLNYEAANELLFEIVEYVEPRMRNDQAYPPVVGMAVLRAKENLTNEQAERKLMTTEF